MGAQPPPLSPNAIVQILSCLAAYSLAQPKVNIGTVHNLSSP